MSSPTADRHDAEHEASPGDRDDAGDTQNGRDDP
jgi:hypothetical protein